MFKSKISMLKRCVVVAIASLLITYNVFASESNGVTTSPGTGQEICGYAYFFPKNYSLNSTSTVYNSAGSSTAEDGWVVINGATDRLIQYNIKNVIGGGTVTVGIYGRIGIGTLEAIIYESIEATGTSSGFIPVTEEIDQIRIGNVISTGTAKVEVTGKFKGVRFSE